MLYVLYLLFKLRTHAVLWEEDEPDDGEADTPASVSLPPFPAALWLTASLVFVVFCSKTLFESIEGSVWASHRMFLGFVILPFLGNVKDYLSSCRVGLENKLDLSILWTLGSSMQILLFVLPLLVTIGWIFDKSITLQFQSFELVAVFIGIFVVNSLVADGKSNYLEGAIAVGL